MRTTVTIEPDTEALLREAVRRTGLSFKEVLNLAVRQALGGQSKGAKVKVRALFSAPFPSALSGVSFNRLADALDDDETLRELRA